MVKAIHVGLVERRERGHVVQKSSRVEDVVVQGHLVRRRKLNSRGPSRQRYSGARPRIIVVEISVRGR